MSDFGPSDATNLDIVVVCHKLGSKARRGVKLPEVVLPEASCFPCSAKLSKGGMHCIRPHIVPTVVQFKRRADRQP